MGAILMNNEQQSQLVRQILQDYIAGDDLSVALELWQRQYQQQTLDKLSFFVFEIAATTSLRKVKKEIEKNLYHALQQSQLIQSEPLIQPKIAEIPPVEPQIIKKEPIVDMQGLAFFLGQLMLALQAEDFQQVMQAVEVYLQEEKVSSDIGQEFLRWLVERRQLNSIARETVYVRQIVNILYSVLCDHWGPVKADRIMMQTIVQAEQKFPLLALRRFL